MSADEDAKLTERAEAAIAQHFPYALDLASVIQNPVIPLDLRQPLMETLNGWRQGFIAGYLQAAQDVKEQP